MGKLKFLALSLLLVSLVSVAAGRDGSSESKVTGVMRYGISNIDRDGGNIPSWLCLNAAEPLVDGDEEELNNKKGIVNPDQAQARSLDVAYGGVVVQDGGEIILSGEGREEEEEEIEDIHITPSCLAIETVAGVLKLIPRKNSFYPTKKSQIFTTYHDRQTSASIKVYDCVRTLTKDCREIGRFNLLGIPPAPRGVPRIEVTVEIDGNGIVRVKAEDKASRKSESITNTENINRILRQEEIERKVKEAAEEFAVENRNLRWERPETSWVSTFAI